MCDEIGVLTDKEVKGLNPKARKTLEAEALKQFRAAGIKKMVNKHPIGKILNPHGDIREKLRKKLLPKLNELKKASATK